MIEAQRPALAGPQICLRPSAPLSLGLKSKLCEAIEARLPAKAGPQVFMRPGAPLSPGLIRRTRCEGAWFTQCGEVSQRSLPGVGGALSAPGCGGVTWAVQPGYLGQRGWVTWGSAAGLPEAARLGYLRPRGWVT